MSHVCPVNTGLIVQIISQLLMSMVLAFRVIPMRSLNGFRDTGEICYNRMGPHCSIVSCLSKHLTRKLKLKNVTRRFNLSHAIIKRNVKFQTLLFGVHLNFNYQAYKQSYREDRYISPSSLGFIVVFQVLQKVHNVFHFIKPSMGLSM